MVVAIMVMSKIRGKRWSVRDCYHARRKFKCQGRRSERGFQASASATRFAPDRMREMMLTGRVCGAEDGEALGLAHCAAGENDALQLTRDAAVEISGNAQFVAGLMIQAIPRISDMSHDGWLFTESLAAAMSRSTKEANEGLRASLEKQSPNFR